MRIALSNTALLLLLACASHALPASDSDHTVVKQGVIKEDLYLAGSEVLVQARVEGDLLVAAGEVVTLDTVRGDAMLAGGTVRIRGAVDDDVRTVGGDVEVAARIGDDLLAAGGNVSVPAGTTVGGRAWLAGGTVTTRSRIGKGARVAAGRIVLGGEIGGDVELYGEQITIEPGTIIHGNLTYWSPDAIMLDQRVRVDGAVTHRKVETDRGRPAAGMHLGLFASLAVTVLAYFLLFPAFSIGAANALRASPWKALGLGLAMLTATPLVILLLWVSLLGVWLGFALLALYWVLLLTGVLTGALAIAEWLLSRRKTIQPDRRWRMAAIGITFLMLWLLCLIPGVGPFTMFALMLFGTGALTLALWGRYRPAR